MATYHIDKTAPATQKNLDQFHAILVAELKILFEENPEYAFAAARTTPEGLARKLTLGLDAGTANKDGEGIKRVCRILKIPHTYKAIRAFLAAE